MAPTASESKKKPTAAANDNGSGGPSPSDRAAAGVRIAGHVRSAATGGKLRRGWSLWRASRELPVAAAGATDLFKRHPVPIALLGGALTTAGLLYAAHAMGAFESDGGAQEEEEPAEPDQEREDDQ